MGLRPRRPGARPGIHFGGLRPPPPKGRRATGQDSFAQLLGAPRDGGILSRPSCGDVSATTLRYWDLPGKQRLESTRTSLQAHA
eukprot:15454291-Alexandrium_andersonii.AAC.1